MYATGHYSRFHTRQQRQTGLQPRLKTARRTSPQWRWGAYKNIAKKRFNVRIQVFELSHARPSQLNRNGVVACYSEQLYLFHFKHQDL